MFNKSFMMFSMLVACAWGKATELTKDNFESFIQDNQKTLVKFYAPWCGHCKKMAPEFDAAAEALEGVASLAKIDLDVEENKAIGSEFGVRGFPTLKFFDNGTAIEYTGGREKNDIIAWVQKMTGPSFKQVNSREEVFELAKTNGNYLLFCGDMGKKSAEFPLFQATADENRGIVNYVSMACNPHEQPYLELVRGDGTSTKHKITSHNSTEEVVAFIKGESLPYFGIIGPENAADYAASGLEVIYFGGAVADYESVKETVEEVAKGFRGTYTFTFLDNVKYSKQAEGMLRTTTFPSFVYPVSEGKKGTYKVEDKAEFTVEFLTQWVNDIKSGAIQPETQSEAIPESNDEPVKVLVAKNWETIVTDDKDVMIEIYAPWCGHCKQLAPEYDSAAQQLLDAGSDAVLAKIDGTANDIPSEAYAFTGFPTLYFKKAGSKPTKYEGGRTAEDIVTYIAKNASKPVEIKAVDKDEL